MNSRCISRRHPQRYTRLARRIITHIHQQGIALLEVLLVATLLGIALLGLASMQTSSLHFNRGAYLHTQASLLAQDILERMRANRPGVTAGHYDEINVAAGSLPSPPACPANQCSPEELTLKDINAWGVALYQTLPEGTGMVRHLADPDRFEVTIRWREKTAFASDAACNPSQETEVGCLRLSARL